eukprot:952804-Prymnesium_polylepis.1
MRRHRRRLSARYALPCVTTPWRRARRHARSLARAKVVIIAAVVRRMAAARAAAALRAALLD